MKLYTLLFLVIISSFCKAQEPLNLMPWPKEITPNSERYVIDENFHINIETGVNIAVEKAATRFLRRLGNHTGIFLKQGYVKNTANVKNPSIIIQNPSEFPDKKEGAYQLTVKSDTLILSANSDVGVLYGLETLLQLVDHDTNTFFFTGVTIEDEPRFVWRGLMIDVSRHYIPVAILKRNLDAMLAVKLNVFHWHLTDDQGFRIASKKRPKLQELATNGKFYTWEEIKDVITYATDRGIRVIPEVDVPGHASAILTAYPELGSKKMDYEIEKYAGIFNPTLDPTNEETYDFLNDIFSELSTLFPNEYVHIGGDENAGKHWNENPEIQKFKKEKGFASNHELQVYFTQRVQQILKKYNKKIVGWEEIMDPKIDTTAIIHSWRGVNEGLTAGASLFEAVKLGYKTILSNGFYIDLMHGAEEHYKTEPLFQNDSLSEAQQKMILGGEATMWSELVTPVTIDSRIWPRTAAIAERLWSSKNITDTEDMYRRLRIISLQLEELGIAHLKNRNQLLRNITKSKDIRDISILADVCEPLKVYTRNKGGTEYTSYAPFTLFADACTADAPDALAFKKQVKLYVNQPENILHKNQIQEYLKKWMPISQNLQAFENPIINQVKPLADHLSKISLLLNEYLEMNILSLEKTKKLKKLFTKAKQPVVDVELMVVYSFEQLLNHLQENGQNDK